MSVQAIAELEAQVRRVVEQAPSALMSWDDVTRGSGRFDLASKVAPLSLRFGALEYNHSTIREWRLCVPAMLSLHHPRPLIVESTREERNRATSLLNSVALRFALSMPRGQARILFLDPFDGKSVESALKDNKHFAHSKVVSFGRPSTVVNWLADNAGETSLLVVCNTPLEDEAEEDDDCLFAFKESELAQLVKYLASPTCRALALLTLESQDPLHPLRIAIEDGSLRATRVHLTNGSVDLSTRYEFAPPSPLFTPDQSPASDIAKDLLARAGLL